MHLCPECNEECSCHDDTGRVVSIHMPANCEHCAFETDEVEPSDDGFYGDEDLVEARPGRRW